MTRPRSAAFEIAASRPSPVGQHDGPTTAATAAKVTAPTRRGVGTASVPSRPSSRAHACVCPSFIGVAVGLRFFHHSRPPASVAARVRQCHRLRRSNASASTRPDVRTPESPNSADGLLEKGPVGVHGDGVADRLEHREVGDRVGVGKRTVEIEVVAFGFFDDGGDLVFAGGIELDLARVSTLGVDLGPACDRSIDPEVSASGITISPARRTRGTPAVRPLGGIR